MPILPHDLSVFLILSQELGSHEPDDGLPPLISFQSVSMPIELALVTSLGSLGDPAEGIEGGLLGGINSKLQLWQGKKMMYSFQKSFSLEQVHTHTYRQVVHTSQLF